MPRSLEDSLAANAANIDGFLNMLVAACDAKVKSYAYAAAIPKWTAAQLKGETVFINDDGDTSRDFCFVANAVQANLLAAPAPEALNQVYNVAVGDRTTLNTLFTLLRDNLAAHRVSPAVQPTHRDFRAGDVRHSQADVGKAKRLLGYAPTHTLAQGIGVAMPWYVGQEP